MIPPSNSAPEGEAGGERFAFERSFVTESPDQTVAWGRRLGELAEPGWVIDLRGPLGAGKTRFVQGLARGLGASGAVRSPTYTIVHRYEGRCPLFHLDVYRVEDPEEVLLQGWDEMTAIGVVAVEWGGRIEEILDPDRLQVEFEHCGESSRRLTFSGECAVFCSIVESWTSDEG